LSYKWKFKDVLTLSPTGSYYIPFRSNGKTFQQIRVTANTLLYVSDGQYVAYSASSGWTNDGYKIIEMDDYPVGSLLQFLRSNAMLLPASNVNKVDLNGVTVLDLTSDTVSPETLLLGTTAHNAKGETITGTLVPCTVYSAENPETFGDDYGYFTWTIPASDHGFSSNNVLVSIYKSTGEQVLGDVKVSPTDYSVTVGLYYDMSISTYAFRAPSGTNIPAGEFRVIIIGPVQTPAAVQQAMLNQLPVYTGGGNY
jgi:hypothetical protein